MRWLNSFDTKSFLISWNSFTLDKLLISLGSLSKSNNKHGNEGKWTYFHLLFLMTDKLHCSGANFLSLTNEVLSLKS